MFFDIKAAKKAKYQSECNSSIDRQLTLKHKHSKYGVERRMTTLEDKILGETSANYCSSSSSESDNDSGGGNSDNEIDAETKISGMKATKWTGKSTNTGPKGVLSDCRQFEQDELEKQRKMNKEKIELIKRYSVNCKTRLEEERDRVKESDEPDLAELYDDFLLDYQRKRMQQMILNEKQFHFGSLEYLADSDTFLELIENDEFKAVVIVVHLYDPKFRCCDLLNDCLEQLAAQFDWIKFCKLAAANVRLSSLFKKSGIPSLLVYKSGQLIGNFVRVTDELGVDFDVENVRDFLTERSILPDSSLCPNILLN